jgi:hypothetical protein
VLLRLPVGAQRPNWWTAPRQICPGAVSAANSMRRWSSECTARCRARQAACAAPTARPAARATQSSLSQLWVAGRRAGGAVVGRDVRLFPLAAAATARLPKRHVAMGAACTPGSTGGYGFRAHRRSTRITGPPVATTGPPILATAVTDYRRASDCRNRRRSPRQAGDRYTLSNQTPRPAAAGGGGFGDGPSVDSARPFRAPTRRPGIIHRLSADHEG